MSCYVLRQASEVSASRNRIYSILDVISKWNKVRPQVNVYYISVPKHLITVADPGFDLRWGGRGAWTLSSGGGGGGKIFKRGGGGGKGFFFTFFAV